MLAAPLPACHCSALPEQPAQPPPPLLPLVLSRQDNISHKINDKMIDEQIKWAHRVWAVKCALAYTIAY